MILEEGGDGSPGRPKPPRRQRFRPQGRRQINLIVALLLAVILGSLLLRYFQGRGWVRVGSLESVNRVRVLYLRDVRIFVVAQGDHPVALMARSPYLGMDSEGHRVLFCRAAQVFQGPDGEMFDRLGVYLLGPAARDMDRVAVRVADGRVDVKPGAVTRGAPHGANRPEQPKGLPCVSTAGEDPPGFFAEAS